MEFKQGEMYKVVLAYSMNDELFTYPPTLIGKCLLSNEKHATLLDPLTNVVQGFKLSQVSTAEPYEASTASVKPETSSVAGKSSGSSVATTRKAPKQEAVATTRKASKVTVEPEGTSHGYFTRSRGAVVNAAGAASTFVSGLRTRARAPVADDSEKSEVSILRTKIQAMLDKSLTTNPKKFDSELTDALKELYRVMSPKCPKSSDQPKSNVIPIVPSETLCIPYEKGKKEDLKAQIGIEKCPPKRHMYLLTPTEFIDRDTLEGSKYVPPTMLFVYTSDISLATYQLC